MRIHRHIFHSCFLLSVCVPHGRAQNLVTNPGLEEMHTCPGFLSQLRNAKGWHSPTHGTPDYFHRCQEQVPQIGVPGNLFGQQEPHTGNGYAGFYALHSYSPSLPEEPYREYITNRLQQPTVPGETYRVSFYISLADRSQFAVDELGVFFSTDSLHFTGTGCIHIIPQVSCSDPHFLDERMEWTGLSACFTADSSYRYMTIGNFNSNAGISYTILDSSGVTAFFAYYYLDDIHLEPAGNLCQASVYIPAAFTPNGDGLNDRFTIYGDLPEEFRMSIFNHWGEEVASLDALHPSWDGDSAPEGIYAWMLEAGSPAGNIPNRKGTVILLR